MKPRSKPTNSHRIEKMNALIQQLLGEILPLYLEGVPGLVTISQVQTSRDMRWVKVWLSIFGGNDDEIFKTLEGNIYHIQGDLNRQMVTKLIPRIQFFLDTAPRYAEHMSAVIRDVIAEDERNHTDSEPEADQTTV
jgi:ribosome-binding factor A